MVRGGLGQDKEGPKKLEKGNNNQSKFSKKAKRKGRTLHTGEYEVYVG